MSVCKPYLWASVLGCMYGVSVCFCCWYDHKFVALLHCQLLWLVVCRLFIFVQNFRRENSQWPDDRYEGMVRGLCRSQGAKGYGQSLQQWQSSNSQKYQVLFLTAAYWLNCKNNSKTESPGHTADRWASWKRWVWGGIHQEAPWVGGPCPCPCPWRVLQVFGLSC